MFCSTLKATNTLGIIHKNLCCTVEKKYSVDEDYYHIKHINDILFNNNVFEHFSKEQLKRKYR